MIRKTLAGATMVITVIAGSTAVAYGHAGIATTGPAGPDGQVPVTLEVPNERSDSGTVKIELVFPASPRIASAQASPVAGWTAVVDQGAGAVNRITWTGGPLTGEDRVDLPVTLGPLPIGTQQVDFRALQTYQDGQVVRWIELPAPGGEEPEKPAPVLTVGADATSSVPTESSTTSSSTTVTTTPRDEATSTTEDEGESSTGVTVAVIVGIVALGSVVAFVAWHRRRRSNILGGGGT